MVPVITTIQWFCEKNMISSPSFAYLCTNTSKMKRTWLSTFQEIQITV